MVNFFLFLSLSMYLVAIINTLNANNITAASINLCTDQYLYLIANKNQITSLSYMSKDKNISFISDKILDIKLNNGRAEEIIRQDPDIIFAGLGSSIATVSLLQKLNYKVVNISDAKNFKQIKEQVYLIAKLLHREKKGLELVNKIDNEIKKFFNYSKRKENKKVIIISPNGYVTGEDTLVGGILKEIGYTNVTSNLNISSYGRISLEQILYSDPEVVIIEDSYSDSVSLSQEFLNHSVIKYIVKKGEVLNLNKKLMNCSGPYSTKIIKELIK